MNSYHGLGDDRMHDLHSGGMMHHMAAKDRKRERERDKEECEMGERVDRFMTD